MYNLSWGPNNINVILHFKNQCNMRSYYRHSQKDMAHLKFFFLHFYSARGLFIFIHSIQNLYYFKECIVCQVYQKILLCFRSLKIHVVSDYNIYKYFSWLFQCLHCTFTTQCFLFWEITHNKANTIRQITSLNTTSRKALLLTCPAP